MDKMYFYIVLLSVALVLALGLLCFIYYNLRQSLKGLKYSLMCYQRDKRFPNHVPFLNKEVAEIHNMIKAICSQLEQNHQDIQMEQDKLLQHFQYSAEGIAFFSATFENLYTNSHFIQFLNVILSQPTFDVSSLFQSSLFENAVKFIKDPQQQNIFTYQIDSNGGHFMVQTIVFEDKSFEITIRDISEAERNNLDRAKMTNNIAHELRTPVASLQGYFETLTEHENMDPQKRNEFIQRAYKQLTRLSDIIQNITLLSKTNDAPQQFTLEPVNIYDLLHELINIESKDAIAKNESKVIVLMAKDVVVQGNHTLLHSIFWNLMSNALKYAGKGTTITINNYLDDADYYYFSFADNGKGVEEQYVNSIFERFYRASEGRTRDQGGSGLGLPIAKDAITFHHGNIVAKHRAEGGLEFLFTIQKK
ncbi:MAG: HAMP domain-containing histidine kinase [Candidatus Symbiothrix sp.]|jgi:two-component system OmpR family sensor kinase/two-component system phosphate regulon sensor histidine kinase PhoR|nr:HAMP domain-containing histidine kinase [Candidatus Symbiothrix sp.]